MQNTLENYQLTISTREISISNLRFATDIDLLAGHER